MIDETKFDKLEKEDMQEVSGGKPVTSWNITGKQYTVWLCDNPACVQCGTDYRQVWGGYPIQPGDRGPACDYCGKAMLAEGYCNHFFS